MVVTNACYILFQYNKYSDISYNISKVYIINYFNVHCTCHVLLKRYIILICVFQLCIVNLNVKRKSLSIGKLQYYIILAI